MDNYSTVLIVDDHPLISSAYQTAFEQVGFQNSDLNFKITIADSCDTAIAKIESSTNHNGFDIVVLDISLPPSSDGTILSGEDLGVKIKKINKASKVIISTMHSDNQRVKSIFKNVDPDGFLVKADINPKELVKAIKAVLSGEMFFSRSVLKIFKNQIHNEYVVDKEDVELLYELSMGTKMKELPNYLNKSIRTIEKRKSNLKEIFGIEDQDDKELIRVAKEKGFI